MHLVVFIKVALKLHKTPLLCLIMLIFSEMFAINLIKHSRLKYV